MTHKLAIPILLLTLSLSCAAQELQRTWSLGPLTWDDFTATPTNADENSLLQYNIGFSPVQENIDGIKSFFYRAEAWMLPSSSWVTADHRTPQLLRYNQVIFDMLEVERRTLQRSLNTSDDPGSYSNMLYGANDPRRLREASLAATRHATSLLPTHLHSPPIRLQRLLLAGDVLSVWLPGTVFYPRILHWV